MATDLLNGSTGKVLTKMSVPISIGMLSTFLFQVVDTYFVGQLGAKELAALGFASTVYFLMVGLFIGVGVGVSIIVGKAAGAGDMTKVKKTSLISLILTLLLSITFSLIGIFTVDPLFSALGARGDVLGFIGEYMVPLYTGMPLLMLSLIGGSILRATGNVKWPEIAMGIGGVINLVFDYLLIFGKGPFPRMGIKGAAYATVLSWCVVIIVMIILLLKDRLIRFSYPTDSIKKSAILKEIRQLGLPAVLTQLIGPATLMYLTFLLARETSNAVAAFGVAGRIETLLLIGVLGVSTASTPFIAQNLGAQKHIRIDEAIVYGGKASVYLGILLFIILMFFIGPIAVLFNDNQQVIDYTKMYFYIVSISYVFYGLYIITSSIFNGLQLAVNSLKIVLVKTFFFTVPLTLIGSFFGITGIFIGISASNILGGVFAAGQMKKQLKKADSSLVHRSPLKDYKNDIISVSKGFLSIFKKK